MQTLLAVIDDLFQFARTAVFGVRLSLPPHKFEVPHFNAMQPRLLSFQKERSYLQSLPTLEDASAARTPTGTLYFIGVKDVALQTDPVMAFDVVSATIPYGEQVRLMKLGGRWAFIRWKEREGWIFKDALRDQAREVFPMLEEGVVYDAENSETKKLRLCIGDAFCGGAASLILTDAEYAAYKLYQKGGVLPWDESRPRTPGTWQKKLRGKPGVHIGIAAHTGSVMEYVQDDIGYVAYVEAVFPDESIKLTAVGLTEEGIYSEAMLLKDQWKELRPVFIEVS